MSRIFKSNYVKIGTPKSIKANIPSIVKKELNTETESVLKTADEEEQANSIIADAKELYLKIIEEANSEASRILNQAAKEKEEKKTAAAEDGYRDGYNSGYSEGITQAQDIIKQAADIKYQLKERYEEVFKEAESQIIELVMEIANKVIGQELIQNKEVIMSLIKQSIARCTFKDKLTIRVSEDDYDYVNENKDKIVILTEGINDLEVYCDKALSKGSCIVETPSGEINAGINVQMKEIEKAFEYLIRNE